MNRYANHELSVIIPVYNEEKAIGSVIENLKGQKDKVMVQINQLKSLEIILVNDGSNDDSLQIMEDGIKNEPDFRIVTHPTNHGYGAALQTGFRESKGDIIAFFDGDHTFKFENIVILLREFFSQDLDMVSGCRFTEVSRMPLVRRIGNKLFSVILFVLTYEYVLDTSSGIRVLKKEILSRHLNPLPLGLNFIMVMTTKTLFENLGYKEVPIPYDERIGPSKLSVINDGLRFLKSILSIVALNNPFKMYFLGTIVAFILALLFYSPALIQYLQKGVFRTDDVNWMIAGTFFLNLSFLTYSIGVISAFINRIIFDRQVRKTIIGRYLASPKLYSKFGILSAILLAVSFLVYGAFKLGLTPGNWIDLIIITTCGFNGFLLASLHFLIKHIEKQVPEVERLFNNG